MSTVYNVLSGERIEIPPLELERRRALIEASDDEHDWDSDYVGSESYTVAECREHIQELERESEWIDWEFRILALDDDGCYCLEVI